VGLALVCTSRLGAEVLLPLGYVVLLSGQGDAGSEWKLPVPLLAFVKQPDTWDGDVRPDERLSGCGRSKVLARVLLLAQTKAG